MTEVAAWTPPTPGSVDWYTPLDAKLAELVAGANSKITGPARFWDRFAERADGALGTSESGHEWIPYGPSTSPAIVGGGMTYSSIPASGGASYPMLQMEGTGRRIGAKFRFGVSSDPGSSAAGLIFWAEDISTTYPSIPDTPNHFTINPNGWTWGYFVGTVLTNIASGTFTTPLAMDGTTVHTAEVIIDPEASTAFLFLPDGSVRSVTHSTIKTINAPYACWEIYRITGTEPVVTFDEVWADDRAAGETALVRALVALPPIRKVNNYSPGSLTQYVMATSGTAPGSLFDAVNASVTFVIPQSGRMHIEASFYLSVTAAAQIYMGLYNGNSLIGYSRVTDDVSKARRTAEWLYTGAPGATVTLALGGFTTVASSATVSVESGTGRNLMMKATPVAV